MYREVIDEVMYEIQQLTGLEYDPTYAGAKADAELVAGGGAGAGPGGGSHDRSGVVARPARLGAGSTPRRVAARRLSRSPIGAVGPPRPSVPSG